MCKLTILKKLSNKILRTINSEPRLWWGRQVYTGPRDVQLSISDVCNSNCIMCWMNSPLIKQFNVEKSATSKKIMGLNLAKRCISGLVSVGTKGIYFTGRGEPLLNNNLPEIITYAKSKGLNCYLTTNGALLNKEIASELINSGLNVINVSLHAGTSETYKKIHPAFNEKTFYHIKDMLNYIHTTKRDKFPEIKLNFVLSTLNFHEILKMIEYAKECCASYISFIPVWTCDDLNSLVLGQNEIQKFYSFEKEVNKLSKSYGIPTNYNSFLSMLSLFFASNIQGNKRTQDFYSKHPCTIGYNFCMILADGRVLPCCASCLVMGNIENQSFEQIWYGEKYNKFRKECLNLPHSKKPVKNCECWNCGHVL